MLGPHLPVICINDFDVNVGRFVDDNKMAGVVYCEEGCQRKQQVDSMNMDLVQKWMEKWQVGFNSSKYVVLHSKRSNLMGKYTINGRCTGAQLHNS